MIQRDLEYNSRIPYWTLLESGYFGCICVDGILGFENMGSSIEYCILEIFGDNKNISLQIIPENRTGWPNTTWCH